MTSWVFRLFVLAALLLNAASSFASDAKPPEKADHDHAALSFDVRSVKSGPWSAPDTWEPKRVPKDRRSRQNQPWDAGGLRRRKP